MTLYTAVFKESGQHWVALCLENGLVGQGDTKGEALDKLKEAIDSFVEACRAENDVHSAPIAINELHEFLALGDSVPVSDHFELRAVYA